MSDVEQGTTMPNKQTVAATIAPHLPYLRRYSRALNGNQEAGDKYVAAVLEALIEDQSLLDRNREPRVALFRLFNAVWGSAQLPNGAPGDARRSVDGLIQKLTSDGRQLLLLMTLEDFSLQDAAYVLGIGPEEAELKLGDARSELQAQSRARVMIIEDEPIIALDIEAILVEMGHEVVGTAATQKAAVALAEETRPELILADIQLADKSSGIDAVNEILNTQEVPVVFVTAYPERLLTGERPEPTYLVTKPFRPETVQTAVGQALFHIR